MSIFAPDVLHIRATKGRSRLVPFGLDLAREFRHPPWLFDSLEADPAGSTEALEQLKALFAIEEDLHMRKLKLAGEAKQPYCLTHAKPLFLCVD